MAAPLKTYQFNVSQEHLDTVKATLPAVAEAGTKFTKHFYQRMFAAHPELLNVFNQTNQTIGGQPKKLLKTVAVAAQAAIEVNEMPGEAIEGICHKHAALLVTAEQYAVVGEHLLGTIKDLLTDDPQVIDAWASLYGAITKAFVEREAELTEKAASGPNGWKGLRKFTLTRKEKINEVISRFKFVPVDGQGTPDFQAGQYITIWADVGEQQGTYATYTRQPRHYTLAIPRNPQDQNKGFSISVKNDGLVSQLLHDDDKTPVGTVFDMSPPFGCFDLSGVEALWLTDKDVPVVFISAGVGITPVLAMLENIYLTRPASWLHAAQNGQLHAYRDRLREISAVRAGFLQRRVWYEHPTPADGPPGGDEEVNSILYNIARYHYEGRMDLPAAAKEFPPTILHLENQETRYFVCGPPKFMDIQKEGLLSLGVDGSRIHWEGFGAPV